MYMHDWNGWIPAACEGPGTIELWYAKLQPYIRQRGWDDDPTYCGWYSCARRTLGHCPSFVEGYREEWQKYMPTYAWNEKFGWNVPLKYREPQVAPDTIAMADFLGTDARIGDWGWYLDVISLRHSGGSNYLFFDGHVEWKEPYFPSSNWTVQAD